MDDEIERFEVKMRPGFKARIADLANQEGVPLGEMIIRAACRAIGYPEADAVAVRKLPGRKPIVSTSAPPAKLADKAPAGKKPRKRHGGQ